MAIIYAVKERTQSKTAMSKVMRYVSQDKKTIFEDEQRNTVKLVSGQNCCGDTAFQEFMETKRRYQKEKGVFFYQYVQSFKPGTVVTPQEIHQMGVELAKYFEGYEVQIATHIDRDHWHNHLVVNSVGCETGLKLQFNEKSLEQFRALSDQICQAHGLEVLKPYRKPKQKSMSAGEYRAAVRGGSYKFKLMNAIDQAMEQSRTQSEFTTCMEQMGYKVKWEPHYKYITYTTPEGQRCRDNRLHESKYFKTEMEEYFNAGLREAKAAQQVGEPSGRAYGTNGYSAISAAGQRDSNRPVEHDDREPATDRPALAGIVNEHLQFAQRGRCEPDDEQLLSGRLQSADESFGEYDSSGAPEYDGDSDYEYGEDDGCDGLEDEEYAGSLGGESHSSGYVAAENQSQMDRHRGIDFDDIVALAKAVEDLVTPYNPEEEREKKKKYVPKGDHKRRKKKVFTHDEDQDLSM